MIHNDAAVMKGFLSDLCFWDQPPPAHAQPQNNQQRAEETDAEPKSQYQAQHDQNPPSSMLSLASSSASQSSASSLTIMKLPRDSRELRWQSAVDPATGSTYYYDSVTRETQWNKPDEIKAWEKQMRAERRKIAKRFFGQMEQNLLASLQRGEVIPGVPLEETPRLAESSCHTECRDEPTAPATAARVRTISCMDEAVLAELEVVKSAMENAAHSATHHQYHLDHPSLERADSEKKDKKMGRPPLPRKTSQPKNNNADAFMHNENISLQREHPSQQPGSPPRHAQRHSATQLDWLEGSSTIINPDVEATIQCVCGVYRAHIEEGSKRNARRPTRYFDVYNSTVFCDEESSKSIRVPSVQEVIRLFHEYYLESKMQKDTIILSLIYVERLIRETNGIVFPSPDNWRSLLLSCMMLASKVWDDFSMWNVDFSDVSLSLGIAPLSLHRVNQLEVAVLTCLKFNVRVPASEYAKYYFLVRNMMLKSGMLSSHSERPAMPKSSSPPQSPSLGRGRRSLSADWNVLVSPMIQSAALMGQFFVGQTANSRPLISTAVPSIGVVN